MTFPGPRARKALTPAVVLGVCAAGAFAFYAVLTTVLEKRNTLERTPLASTQELATTAPAPSATSWASVVLSASVTALDANVRIQVLDMAETCLEDFPRVALAGRGSYVLAAPGVSEKALTSRACIEVFDGESPQLVPEPGRTALGITGEDIYLEDLATHGVRLAGPGGWWYLTATAVRAEGRPSLALGLGRSPSPWTIQVPGPGKAPSVAALLHAHDLATWRASFPLIEPEVEVEDGTLPAEPASSPASGAAPSPKAEDYAPL